MEVNVAVEEDEEDIFEGVKTRYEKSHIYTRQYMQVYI